MIHDNLGGSYSSIISPADYNRLMSKEHLYISQSDIFITETIRKLSKQGYKNVVELGCGPGRLLERVVQISEITLLGIDADEVFIDYAKNMLKSCKNVNIIKLSVFDIDFDCKVDVFYSQGFHHHIAPGADRQKYLSRVHESLVDGGYYIVGDEFIPDYDNAKDREILLVVWYCHIIAHAIKHRHDYLAQEEAKTLLDDLQEGRVDENIKTIQQIELVLEYAPIIDALARSKKFEEAQNQALLFLKALSVLNNISLNNDITIDGSRGDYKICDSVFIREVTKANFKISEKAAFGPIEDIGAMAVYILQKS